MVARFWIDFGNEISKKISPMLIFGRCRYYWIWLLLIGLILSGCSEQLQSETMFISQQEDSGLIAYLGTDGNLYTIDREGENTPMD